VNVTQIIRDMREWLDAHEWAQGELYTHQLNEDGMRIFGITGGCLDGAVNIVLSRGRTRWDAKEPYALRKQVGDVLLPVITSLFPDRVHPALLGFLPVSVPEIALIDDTKWPGIIAFNDNPQTTKEDVLLVLKHAAGAEDE